MRIRWTEPSARDLTHICDYIEEHDGPAAARRIALTIHQGVGSLTQFPYRGRPGRKWILANWYFQVCPVWPYTESAQRSLKSTASCMAHRSGLRVTIRSTF